MAQSKGTSTNKNASLTGHIRILRHGVSEIGERFVKLQINGGDGKRTTLERIDDLDDGKGLCKRLNLLGAHLITVQARTELLKRIQAEGPQASSFTVATKVGWYGHQFVFPDGVVAGNEKPIRVYPGAVRPELPDAHHTWGLAAGGPRRKECFTERRPHSPGCRYPAARRSNPTCRAPGTMG